MTRLRIDRRLAIGVLALAVLLVVATIVAGRFRQEPAPASPAVLERISDRNKEAAVEAAARQRADSEASAEATDLAIEGAEERGRAGAEEAIRGADANEAVRQEQAGQ